MSNADTYEVSQMLMQIAMTLRPLQDNHRRVQGQEQFVSGALGGREGGVSPEVVALSGLPFISMPEPKDCVLLRPLGLYIS